MDSLFNGDENEIELLKINPQKHFEKKQTLAW